jgi:hypothetical protein
MPAKRGPTARLQSRESIGFRAMTRGVEVHDPMENLKAEAPMGAFDVMKDSPGRQSV